MSVLAHDNQQALRSRQGPRSYAPSGTSPGRSGPAGSAADVPMKGAGWLYGRQVADDFTERYRDLLTGSV